MYSSYTFTLINPPKFSPSVCSLLPKSRAPLDLPLLLFLLFFWKGTKTRRHPRWPSQRSVGSAISNLGRGYCPLWHHKGLTSRLCSKHTACWNVELCPHFFADGLQSSITVKKKKIYSTFHDVQTPSSAATAVSQQVQNCSVSIQRQYIFFSSCGWRNPAQSHECN